MNCVPQIVSSILRKEKEHRRVFAVTSASPLERPKSPLLGRRGLYRHSPTATQTARPLDVTAWLERALPDARRNRKAEHTAVCGVPARAAGAGQGEGGGAHPSFTLQIRSMSPKRCTKNPFHGPLWRKPGGRGTGTSGGGGVLLFHSTPLDAARAAH